MASFKHVAKTVVGITAMTAVAGAAAIGMFAGAEFFSSSNELLAVIDKCEKTTPAECNRFIESIQKTQEGMPTRRIGRVLGLN